MKVKIKDGVYQDKRGTLFHVEIGYSDSGVAVRFTGLGNDGEETSRAYSISNPHFNLMIALITNSKYLGVL